MEMSGLIGPGVFQISPRRKKKTGRAGFISVSTGTLTRPRGLPWGAAWAITFSTTLSRRRTRNLEVNVNLLVWALCMKQLCRDLGVTVVNRRFGRLNVSVN